MEPALETTPQAQPLGPDWVTEFPGAVTVCAVDGTILYMNARSADTFAADGGLALLGQNVLDCHPPAARAKMEAMLASGRGNVYTIEKQGRRKLIYQSPWYAGGEYAGFVELSLELPAEMPHFIRG